MAGPGETVGSPRPPLAKHQCPHAADGAGSGPDSPAELPVSLPRVARDQVLERVNLEPNHRALRFHRVTPGGQCINGPHGPLVLPGTVRLLGRRLFSNQLQSGLLHRGGMCSHAVWGLRVGGRDAAAIHAGAQLC
jgi:hypothetical protein